MKELLIEYITNLLPLISKYDHQERSIVLKKIEVKNPDTEDLGFYLKNSLSMYDTIIFTLDTLDKEGKVIESYSRSLDIPKCIDGKYILNGSIRMNELILGTDNRVRFLSKSILINDEYTIKLNESNRSISTAVLIIDNAEYALDQFDYESNKNLTKFSKYEANKLQVKLDLESLPSYLTEELVIKMINFGLDKSNDNIIDKKISTISVDVLNHLNESRHKYNMVKQLQKNFRRHGKVYLTAIQSRLDFYFNGGKNSRVRFAPLTNPLGIDTMPYKIKIPTQVAYNSTFKDIIDPINTPENTNINEINEVNVCVDLSKADYSIFCYKAESFEIVSLSYIEYLNAKVLHSDHFDYDENSIITSEVYKYKYHQKLYETNDISIIEYIEPKPDDRLSITTRQLPLINASDPSRVRMGSGMSKQAVEVVSHEPRLLSSGNEDEDYLKHTLTSFYVGSGGVVESIVDKIIKIKNDDGSQLEYSIPDTIEGLNGANTSFVSKVTPGDRVSEKQPIITTAIQKNKQYELGVNARIGYMVYKGKVHEDAFVVSESFTKKMSYYSTEDVEVEILPEDEVTYITPIGDEIKSLDRLVGKLKDIRDNPAMDQYKNKFSPARNVNPSHIVDDAIVPNGVDIGWVVDLRIKRNGSPKLNPHGKSKTDIAIERYLKYLLKPGDISTKPKNLVFPEKLPKDQLNNGIPNFKVPEKCKYKIIIRILKYNKLKVASKLTNSWGSKGMVSCVLPDDKMPYTGDKSKGTDIPLEVIINPYSILARMNLSQLYEVLITKCIKKSYEKLLEYKNTSPEEGLTFIKKYYNKQFKNFTSTELYELLDKKGISALILKVGSFSKINRELLLQWADEVGVQETEKVTIPDLGEVELPQLVGYSYIMRLYHNGDAYAKVTSSIRTKGQPLLGRGEYRDEGQKFGEMENWIADAADIYKFVIDKSKDYLLNQYVFLNHLLLAGFTVVNSFGNPLLTKDYISDEKILQLLGPKKQKRQVILDKIEV